MKMQVVVAMGLALCVASGHPQQTRGTAKTTVSPTTNQPKLIVAIIVDQFRYDYTTRFAARYTGGLHTLLTQGAVFVDAHQDHFPTVTATGHATFLTGSIPATSGIIGNEWFDRKLGRNITSVEDSDTKLVGLPDSGTGSSPHNLLVSTLGDELKIADHNTSKVIGISMKDRAAILPSGRMADAAYWVDSKTGQVVSSTWYQQRLPEWAVNFNDEKPSQKALGKSWYPLGSEGRGKPFRTLPNTPNNGYYSVWETTPYANDMLEQFAEQTLEHEDLGHHKGTDLLTVSFSANDHLGHQVGPDAPEVEDMSVRTDLAIAKLLAAAEKQAGGKEHLVVVLSADHGVVAVPEVSIANKMPGGRADKTQYTKTVSDALETRFGAGKWIIGGWENGFYLNYDLIREKKIKESDVEAEAAHAVSQAPYVERVYTRTELMHRHAMASTIDDYVARSFFPERGPDVYVVLKPYWLMGGGSGTSHGSPYNYDTHVPLIFFGEDIKPGVYTDRVGISDVAPTLAAYLHIQQPSGSVGHVLAPVVQTHLGSRSSQ